MKKLIIYKNQKYYQKHSNELIPDIIQSTPKHTSILSIIFFSCNDLNDLSIVLLVTPIFSASSIDVRLGFSIKSSITFFSVLFKPTFLLSIW